MSQGRSSYLFAAYLPPPLPLALPLTVRVSREISRTDRSNATASSTCAIIYPHPLLQRGVIRAISVINFLSALAIRASFYFLATNRLYERFYKRWTL